MPSGPGRRYTLFQQAIAESPVQAKIPAGNTEAVFSSTGDRIRASQAKAAVASPSEQPWLYAQLVHSMTELATAQYQAGDRNLASQSLKSAQGYAGKIQMNLLHDAKKLKNAEILIRHTGFRLRELLTGASLDDRPTLEATIAQLNEVQSQMMLQVFHR